MSARAPLDRLAPADFYKQLDWLRNEWDRDEYEIAAKLTRLRRMYEHLPTRYYERALPLLGQLAKARIAKNVRWRSALITLARIVGEWDRSRPPVLGCEVCGVAVRGHPALCNHYEIVHPEHARPALPSG